MQMHIQVSFKIPAMDDKNKNSVMMQSLIPGPAYRIETHRLVLRCWDPKDVVLLKNAIDGSLDHLRPWMPWAHNEPEEIEVKVQRIREWRARFDTNQDFVYGIFNIEETEVLGGTGLHTRIGKGAREIGYWIRRDCTHQGLATETTSALVKVGFEVDELSRIEIHCNPDNEFSAAIPRKLGFCHEATLKRRTPGKGNTLFDTMIWTLFREEYPTTLSAKIDINAFNILGQKIL